MITNYADDITKPNQAQPIYPCAHIMGYATYHTISESANRQCYAQKLKCTLILVNDMYHYIYKNNE